MKGFEGSPWLRRVSLALLGLVALGSLYWGFFYAWQVSVPRPLPFRVSNPEAKLCVCMVMLLGSIVVARCVARGAKRP